MTIAQALFSAFAVIFFLYLCLPSRSAKKPAAQSSRNERKSRDRQVSGMTGLMGGSVEDAFISQHALNRGHGDSTNASDRDVAASVGMQQAD